MGFINFLFKKAFSFQTYKLKKNIEIKENLKILKKKIIEKNNDDFKEKIMMRIVKIMRKTVLIFIEKLCF